MRPLLVCGLDIGSSKISGLCMLVERNRLNRSIKGKTEISARFMNEGLISDVSGLTEGVKQALEDLEKQCSVSLDKVYMNISGRAVRIKPIDLNLAISSGRERVINSAVLRRLYTQAKWLSREEGEEPLHTVGVDFRLDRDNVVSDPLFLYANKISMAGLVISGLKNQMKDLREAVETAQHFPGGVFYSGLVGFEAVAGNEPKASDYILIDIGAQLTEISLFRQGKLVAAQIFLKGGDSLTRLVASRLNLDFEEAEKLKNDHGMALGRLIDAKQEIMLRTDKGQYSHFTLDSVSELIEAELSSWFKDIREWLKKAVGIDQYYPKVKLIGQVSLMGGLAELLEEFLGIKVELAKSSNSECGMEHIICLGLILQGVKKGGYSFLEKRASLWRESLGYIRQLYKDYF